MSHTEHGIYAIWDRKASLILPAFSANNDTAAERMFIETVMTSETPVSQYPADFDLIRIGTVSIELGSLTAITPPRLLVNGLTCLQEAHRQRQRYQAILNSAAAPETSPDAS